MPRAGWKKPESERRLADRVSVGELTRAFPPALVDEVIAKPGRDGRGPRAWPARALACFPLGVAGQWSGRRAHTGRWVGLWRGILLGGGWW